MMRGKVTAVDASGVYVQTAEYGTLGPLPWLGTKPAVGASVLLDDTGGNPATPDLVVLGGASVRDFGARGDGVTDDTAALQSALDAVSAVHGTLIVPHGIYRTTATLFPRSDTTISGPGVIDGHVLDTDDHNAGQDPVIYILADDVHIEGITIVGNKAEYAAATEFKHGISIASSNRVTIRDVTTTDNKGDGVCVMAGSGIGSGNGDPCTQIVLDNVTAEYNHRQGLSVTSAIGLRVVGGSYSYTSGTAPQSGIDIEPDIDEHVIDAVDIVDVAAVGNAGSGVIIVCRDGSDCRNVRISGGRIADNAMHGVGLYRDNRLVTIESVTIEGNTGSGVEAVGTKLDGLRIVGNIIRGNGTEGVKLYLPAVAVTGLSITGNLILDNSTDTTKSGVLVDVAGPVMTGWNVIGNAAGTGNQTYGITTTSNVTAETHIANDLAGNDTGEASYAAAAQAIIVPT